MEGILRLISPMDECTLDVWCGFADLVKRARNLIPTAPDLLIPRVSGLIPNQRAHTSDSAGRGHGQAGVPQATLLGLFARLQEGLDDTIVVVAFRV